MSEFLNMQGEEAFMDVREKVHIFNAGIGPIEPTGEVSDTELIEAIESTQVKIQDEHIVCIDERNAIETQPARRKTAGGPTITGYAAVLLSNGWSLLTDAQKEAGPLTWYEPVVDHQAEAGVPLGGHTDNHAPEDDPSCGAAKKLAEAIDAVADHGEDEEWVELGKLALGDNFDQQYWGKAIENARKLKESQVLVDWKPGRMIEALKRHNAVIEVLNGDQDALRDPENLRHNHWAQAVNIGHDSTMTNDRDNSPIAYFQVDVDAIVESVSPLASSETEFKSHLHGAVLYNIAIAYVLTRNQRFTQTGLH